MNFAHFIIHYQPLQKTKQKKRVFYPWNEILTRGSPRNATASCGDQFCADLAHLKRDYCLMAKRLKISQYDLDLLIDKLFPYT